MDVALPFGLHSAPLLFTAVADALQWIMRERGVDWVDHYIDDYITMGAPKSPRCGQNVAIMKQVCEETGLPTEPEKDEGPATSIDFLGMELDTVVLKIHLPPDKLSQL